MVRGAAVHVLRKADELVNASETPPPIVKLAAHLDILASRAISTDNSQELAKRHNLSDSGVRGILTGRRGLPAHIVFGLHWRQLVRMKKEAGDDANARIVAWLEDALSVSGARILGADWAICMAKGADSRIQGDG